MRRDFFLRVMDRIDVSNTELQYEWVSASDVGSRRRALSTTSSLPLSESGNLMTVFLRGELVGYVVGEPFKYIHMLYVLTAHRGRCIGRCVVADFAAPKVYSVLPEREMFWRRCSYVPSPDDVENEWVSTVYKDAPRSDASYGGDDTVDESS